ncbi:hypothetical protein V5N11_020498 [Cardamine amara subsp. amara]|uniref:Uncharacterized protein n=1 Tax=Cardamine amara subsp. amara TaxID=228776 RepID=A0ABD1ATL2_CARAN
MGDNENWRSELDGLDGLSLIDVSTEDDSLLFSSFLDPTTYDFSDSDEEGRGLCLFGDSNNCDEEILVSTSEEKEPLNKMKTNLRKSLAWDKAFFTNAGFLEPDELCSMMESNQMGEKKVLPTIQEDVNKSTESISTLKSDCTVETGQEFGLFEDVRAPTQRYVISSDVATPQNSKVLGETETAPSPPANTLDDPDYQKNMKSNPIRKRPQVLGKATKQPLAAKEHNTSISRPASGVNKTLRASVEIKKAKQEKNPKLSGGKEPLAPRAALSRSTRPIVSKPVVPFKSTLRSSAASKNELTSSCSSLESCLSVSSGASNKSSLDSLKKKKDQSLRIASHSLTNRPTSRAGSKSIGQPKVPAGRTYKSKFSSTLSASVDWSSESPRASTPSNGSKSIGQPKAPSLSASRIYKSKLLYSSTLSASVDWSSESLRASTPNKMAKGYKKSVPGERGPAIDAITQTLRPLNNSAVQDELKSDKLGAKRGSVVNSGSVSSASMMKPTELRVPSPNIGYFDGARSSVARTPTGSGLVRKGTGSPNESSATRTKSGQSQPQRSPLIQESTNSKAKVSHVPRSSRLIVSASPKLTNKMYSKVSAEEHLKGNEEADYVAR